MGRLKRGSGQTEEFGRCRDSELPGLLMAWRSCSRIHQAPMRIGRQADGGVDHPGILALAALIGRWNSLPPRLTRTNTPEWPLTAASWIRRSTSARLLT